MNVNIKKNLNVSVLILYDKHMTDWKIQIVYLIRKFISFWLHWIDISYYHLCFRTSDKRKNLAQQKAEAQKRLYGQGSVKKLLPGSSDWEKQRHTLERRKQELVGRGKKCCFLLMVYILFCFNCLTFLICRRKDLHKYVNRFPKRSMKIDTWGITGECFWLY